MMIAALSILFGLSTVVTGRVIDISEHGAVPFVFEANITNAKALNDSFLSAQAGDTVLVPANKTFYLLGGIRGRNLVNVTFLVEGTLKAVFDLDNWPKGTSSVVGGNHYVYLDFIALSNATDLVVASSTNEVAIDGGGKPWWNACLFGEIGYGERPVLLSISVSTRVKVFGVSLINRYCMIFLLSIAIILLRPKHCRHLILINSPRFHLFMSQNEDVEIYNVNVTVDRRLSEVKEVIRERRFLEYDGSGPSEMLLQPEDMNTDGIDM